MITVTPGSAQFKYDYIGKVTTLHFANDQPITTTIIQILNDDLIEGDEDFHVSLAVLEGGTVGSQNEITVTILDDEKGSSENEDDYKIIGN